MERAQQQQFRRLIESLMERLQPDVTAITEQARGASGGQAATDLSNAPMHLGDSGTEEYLHDLNATLLENEEFMLEELQAALDKLDTGTFGTCENCEEAIKPERLEAIPYTRFCFRCAEVADGSLEVNFNRGRPKSPRDTLAPEGEMGENGRPSELPLEVAVSGERSHAAFEHRLNDEHAAGTPGGGTFSGGLAGTNEGHGDPNIGELDEAMGSGNYDVHESREDDSEPED